MYDERSGYLDDYEYMDLYRANVNRSIKGKRGQFFLKQLLEALEAMPEKALLKEEVFDGKRYCPLGAIWKHRGLSNYIFKESFQDYKDEWGEIFAKGLNIAKCLANEIIFINDSGCFRSETPDARWNRMHKWVLDNIIKKESVV